MLGENLGGIAFNPYSNKIYVTDTTSNAVSVIDSNSRNVTKNIQSDSNPTAIAVNPYSNKVYVANSGNNTVSIIAVSIIAGVQLIQLAFILIRMATARVVAVVVFGWTKTYQVLIWARYMAFYVHFGKVSFNW
jgi:YVTN family beta-propeller protein